MTRSVTPLISTRLTKLSVEDIFSICLELNEEGSTSYVRLIRDNADKTIEGNLYQQVLFEANLLTDSEQETTAVVSIQNVDEQIGEAVFEAKGRLLCRMFIYDHTEDTIIYDTQSMVIFKDIAGNALNISGTLGPAISELEPFPFLRAIKSVTPGLYL